MNQTTAAVGQDEPLPPVAVDLFAAGEDGKYGLVGGCCPTCQRDFYPRLDFCPGCLQPAQRTILGGSGRIYSFTVIRTRPPYQLPEPYAVGYIDLEESGLRVFGLFVPQVPERLQIGMPVEMTVIPLGVDNEGKACRRPVFLPLPDDMGRHHE